MIVKMNKYAFMVYHKEYDAFLERLRSLGVVHVNKTKPTQEHPVMQQLKVEDKRVKTQLDFLQNLLPPETERAATSELSRQESEILLNKIEDLRERLSKIESSIVSKTKERDAIAVWGDFSFATIEKLRHGGYDVSFFTCPLARFDEKWEKEYNAQIINVQQSTAYFITVTHKGTEPAFDAEHAKMPHKDYQQLCEAIAQDNIHKKEIESELLEIAQNHYRSLQQIYTEIENETAWNHVLIETDHKADEKLMLLEGWIPNPQTAEMEQSLNDAGYFYQKIEITDEDTIPITIQNNKFSRLFEPITRLYSLPNYFEFDPTPLLAPFFMLFFGLCFGDGGYGLLLIATALILRPKMSESMKPILTLLMCLGLATLTIGILTGSFFGLSLVEIKSLAPIKDYFISSDNLMIISLVIGFIHVLYGKFIAAVKIKIQRGFKYSAAAFAWIFVILSMTCVLALPMANIQLPKPVEYALYGIAILCGLVVLLYNTPGKNVFLNFGSGLWNTYNVVSGLVGDVLSYIRLYAIGLTGALLGGVFNSMAIDMTVAFSPFVRWPLMLLILLVGHALNIALCLIGSLVHPLRLIYVEYYKNSEFEGGGLDYKPFKKI